MSGETPGQAAYEAHYQNPAMDFRKLSAPEREHWEAVARAGLAAILGEHPGPQPAPELAESVECEACGLHRPPTSAEQAAPGLADATARGDRLEGQNEDLRAKLQAIRALAEPAATRARNSPKEMLALAILEQLDAS